MGSKLESARLKLQSPIRTYYNIGILLRKETKKNDLIDS